VAKFTLSQLDEKPDNYDILDTDLLLLTIGTDTPFLSSVKISTQDYATYVTAFAPAGGWVDDGTVIRLGTSTDKVGIGTTAPSEALTVAGNVSARGVVYGTQYHVIPTTVADLGAAINSAFTQGFSAIQLQAGHYTMSTTVDIPKRHTVLGTGFKTTRIDFTTNNTAFRLSGEYIELGGMSIDFTGTGPAIQHTKCGVQLGASTAPIGYASRCHVHDLEVFMAGNHGIDCDVITMCSFGDLATVSCSGDGFHVNTAVDGCHANNSYGVIDTRGNKRHGFTIIDAGNSTPSQANRWGPIVAQSNNRGGSSYHGGWESLSGNGVHIPGAVKNVFESIYSEQNEHGYSVNFGSNSKLNDVTILHSGGTGHGDHNVNVGTANRIHVHGPGGDSAAIRTVYGKGNSLYNPTLSGDWTVTGDVGIGGPKANGQFVPDAPLHVIYEGGAGAGFKLDCSATGNRAKLLVADNDTNAYFIAEDGYISIGGCDDLAADNLNINEDTGAVGIGTISPNANAMLDVTSTTKAFMPPRMTTTERDAVASPAAGMVVYNITTNVLNFHNGSAWGAV
jgi:ethanolamine utilization microcompartment shell protein EutS